jgi:hypothetical protein
MATGTRYFDAGSPELLPPPPAVPVAYYWQLKQGIDGGAAGITWKAETVWRERLAPRAKLISQNLPIETKLGLIFAMPAQLWGRSTTRDKVFFLPSDAFSLSFIRKRTHSGTKNRLELQNRTCTCWVMFLLGWVEGKSNHNISVQTMVTKII